jgi:hypothetical protein
MPEAIGPRFALLISKMKKQYFKLILKIAVACMLSHKATATVDPLEGSFKTEIAHQNFKISYNSKSLNKGSLGIGWQLQSLNQKIPNHTVKNGLLIQFGPYKMIYNQHKNLISIRGPKINAVIKYDDANDTVVWVRKRNCQQEFSYSFLETQKTYTQITVKKSSCGKSERLQFVFLKTNQGLQAIRQGNLP